MTLKEIIAHIQDNTPTDFDYQWLGDFVRKLDFKQLDWSSDLPTIDRSDDYARNILCLDPYEVVLLHWPPGVESAVHLHEGFWGYVLCLEGVVENVAYGLNGGVMERTSLVQAFPGGILPEPDGTIHKIRNGSQTERLVTLHFYSPALDSLDGLKLYDLASGTIKTLNDLAPTASLHLPDDHYATIEQDAFVFKTADHRASHELVPVLPKPNPSRISELIQAYYNEQADVYDAQDQLHAMRRTYTRGVNKLISSGLQNSHGQSPIDRVLHVACGTGRRALEISEATGIPYAIHGMDMSSEMVEIAQRRGIEVTAGNVLTGVPPAGEEGYDAITFLYAYGHLSNREERAQALRKMHKWLKPGGRLYFDAFDIDDPNEWGHQAKSLHQTFQLDKQGYERGDVFYRRRGGDALAFLHYSSAPALNEVLESIGFEVMRMERVGYAVSPGELVDEGGNLFVEARKSTTA